ncbi:MAG: hypothetical protein WKG06_28210 [Segetibacter sp.]
MNSAQQMSVLGELDRKGILAPDILSRSDYGVYGKMYDLINTPDANGNFALLNTTEAKAAFLKNMLRPILIGLTFYSKIH